jgi:anti-sigma B factor antagonist
MSGVQVATENRGDAAVVALDGTIDGSSVGDAQAKILPQIAPGCRLVLDMANLEYMSSAGLRMLLLIFRQVTGQGGKVALAGLSEEIRDTMSLTGFLDFFTTTETVEEALAAVRA